MAMVKSVGAKGGPGVGWDEHAGEGGLLPPLKGSEEELGGLAGLFLGSRPACVGHLAANAPDFCINLKNSTCRKPKLYFWNVLFSSIVFWKLFMGGALM